MSNSLLQTRVIGEERGFPLAISGQLDAPWIVGYDHCDVITRHYLQGKAEAKELAWTISARLSEKESKHWAACNGVDGLGRTLPPPRTIRIKARQNEAAA